MGHRASYAIRENGQLRVFYSHWGALTVPQDVFWGPDHAERFILSLEESGEWINNLDAEGGVALDKDARHIAFFGGEDLDLPAIRPLFVELMATIWAEHGWTVEWARDIQQVAERVGVDPDELAWPPTAPDPVDIDTLGARFAEENMYQGLISVRDGTRWRDHVADHPMSRLLMHGPAILDHLDRLPDLEQCRAVHASRPLRSYEQERGTLGDHLQATALVDPLRRHLIVRGSGLYHEPDDEPFVRSAWPDWTVEWLAGTLADHIKATGRVVTDEHRAVRLYEVDEDETVAVTEDEALDLIRSQLLGSGERKAELASFARRVAANVAADQAGPQQPWWRRLLRRMGHRRAERAQWAPGFFSEVPAVGPEHEQAEHILKRAIAARRASRQLPP